MPGKSAHVKNEKQYEALKDKGMSKERAAKIANSPDASARAERTPFRLVALVVVPGRNDGAEEGRRCQGRTRDRPQVVELTTCRFDPAGPLRPVLPSRKGADIVRDHHTP